MRRVTAALLSLAVVAGLAGCGLPDSSDVQVHGPKPSPNAAAGADGVKSPTRAASTDAEGFLTNFLAAAAGEPDQAIERMREFMAPKQAAEWNPPGDINVIRLTEDALINPLPANTYEVTLKVQQIGVLSQYGAIGPATVQETQYSLTIGRVQGESGLWMLNAPPMVLLSDEALDYYYEAVPLYFWNKGHSALIPDLRYLPTTVPEERRPTELLEWLGFGPSPLIAPAVEPLPANVKQKGNVPLPGPDGALEVNLTAEAAVTDEKAVQLLGRQLFWTLRANFEGDLLLKVEGQLRATFTREDRLLAANPSWDLGNDPTRFAIYNGGIVRVRQGEAENVVLPPVPVVTEETNSNVRLAGFARYGNRTFGAWVRSTGKNAFELVAGVDGGAAPLRIPLGGAGPVGRPIWLWTTDDQAIADSSSMVTGLITVGGQIKQFGVRDASLTPVPVTGLPGAVTSLAVAHDGQRVALVAGGRLFVAVLTRNDTSVKVGTPMAVPTTLRNITGADFTSETTLIVAGTGATTNRVGLYETSLDGAIEGDRVEDLGSSPVTYLDAYPVGPLAPEGSTSQAAYVANEVANDLFQFPSKIELPQLDGVPAEAGPSKIEAPFFLE